MTQTAIEWLISNIESNINPKLTQKELIERVKQAKEMEKQQIIDAYHKGYASVLKVPQEGYNTEKYYNETFKKK